MKYCLAEDSDRFRFGPFTLIRPVDSLRIGMSTIYEKWKQDLHVSFIDRSVPFPLSIAWQSDCENVDVYINPRVLPNRELISHIQQLALGSRLVTEKGDVIAIKPIEKNSSFLAIDRMEFNHEKVISYERILTHVWELMLWNGSEIELDAIRFNYVDNRKELNLPGVHIDGDHLVYIHPTAKIEPGVFLLAYDGPIIIEANAHIMSGNYLRGALSIGEFAMLKMGGHIYGETSIGPYCRVGGEIKNSIFHSYSNKAHGGYVGNAIIGEWCNWGADTNCSNLKNNYGSIRISKFPNGETVDSGLQFLGVLMGDHTKTAINTSINTGSVFGVMSNIATSTFPPKFLKSFSWITDGHTELYQIDKAIETIRHIKNRRSVNLSISEEELLRVFYAECTSEKRS